MKRAELGLLEVLGLLVECRGKVIIVCNAYEVQLIGIIPYATSSATYVYPHPNIIIFKLIIVCNAYEVQSIGIPYATLVLLLYHRIIYIVIVFIGIHRLMYNIHYCRRNHHHQQHMYTHIQILSYSN